MTVLDIARVNVVTVDPEASVADVVRTRELDRELDALSADREVEAELDQLRDESGGGETTETESADATESEVETTDDGGTSGGTESDEEPADPAVEAELEQLRDDDSQ